MYKTILDAIMTKKYEINYRKDKVSYEGICLGDSFKDVFKKLGIPETYVTNESIFYEDGLYFYFDDGVVVECGINHAVIQVELYVQDKVSPFIINAKQEGFDLLFRLYLEEIKWSQNIKTRDSGYLKIYIENIYIYISVQTGTLSKIVSSNYSNAPKPPELF